MLKFVKLQESMLSVMRSSRSTSVICCGVFRAGSFSASASVLRQNSNIRRRSATWAGRHGLSWGGGGAGLCWGGGGPGDGQGGSGLGLVT